MRMAGVMCLRGSVDDFVEQSLYKATVSVRGRGLRLAQSRRRADKQKQCDFRGPQQLPSTHLTSVSSNRKQRLAATLIGARRLALATGPPVVSIALARRLRTKRCYLRVNRLDDCPPKRIHRTVGVVRRLGQSGRQFGVDSRDSRSQQVVSILEVEIHGALCQPARGGNFLDAYVGAASFQNEVASRCEHLIAKSRADLLTESHVFTAAQW